MKLNSFIASGIVVSCLALAWVAASAVHADPAPTTQKSADATPVNKMCPVETDQAIDPAVTTVYKGKTYAFCCKDCVAKFNADPEKYAAAAK